LIAYFQSALQVGLITDGPFFNIDERL